MKLFVVRHAEAVEKGTMPDGTRYLTPEGRRFFRTTVKKLDKKGCEPDVIFTSPLVRAVQTAEILAEGISFDGAVAAVDALADELSKEGLLKLLEGAHEAKSVALVGHEPYLGDLVRELLGKDTPFAFPKGGCICIKLDGESGSASFKWMIAGKKEINAEEGLFA